MGPTLTIFTPTFNRAYSLHLCYESLKRQTCKDFIWLIIDDGSTDNTKELINSWIEESVVPIKYYYQENQGMHGAHNTAYEMIDTELNVCIDSDDYMPIDAVELIVSFWRKHGSNKVSGIVGLDVYKNGEVVGSKLPTHLNSTTLYDLYMTHKVTGDKKLIYRSELTKKYPYPVYKDEKYVGLSYKYHKIDEDYQMLLLNEPLCVVEYLEDGSSLNMLNQYKRNPKGFSFLRVELMKLPFASTSFKFRQAIHYVSSSLLLRNRRFLKETPSKLLTILAMPVGTMLYIYILVKS
ncbi:glycosyltransferase family 2 protein [Evansella sp. LMS18]|uniref:glycosyltransferase family 2 protein n=1 Tax=Evansella sp. LMS18 TaxID=2924033 RepID=UPI0020D079A8|nr:glycosyltransferase family 2 protein [Evansella sp. LMS18]UTR10582.1 glycosyltransferase family 2 protein [Evansella sp. LMS18]